MGKVIRLGLLLLFLVNLAGAGLCAADKPEPVDLYCEYLKEPLGIDEAKPRLSWRIVEDGGKSEDRGQRSEVRGQNLESSSQKSEIRNSAFGIRHSRGMRQTAYQVLVASTPELLAKNQGDLWDSGKVESDRSIHVEYAGKKLESRMRCCWKIRVWIVKDEGGNLRPEEGVCSEWSKMAFWTMGSGSYHFCSQQ